MPANVTPTEGPGPRILVHGGAGAALEPARAARVALALQAIARAGHDALQGGACALDVVVNAVRRLEDDPQFNAGTGARLQIDGEARLSASVMDGQVRRFGGVVNVRGLRNPILLARALMDDEDRVLCGAGALLRARELGLEEGEVRTPERLAEWRARVEGQTGTVGAVALDGEGRLAAATSTGGRGFEAVGRVSDSPTVAATYASDVAAVSMTGVGEHIVEGAMAARLVTLVEAGVGLEAARDRLLRDMRRQGWQAGLIAVDTRGAWVAAHSTPGMSWWACGPGGEQGPS